MEAWLDLLGGIIARKTNDRPLTEEQRIVLAYLLKCERLNRAGLYTLALTPGNNHFGAINALKTWGLIDLHPTSTRFREVYVVCRELASDDHLSEVRQLFGSDFEPLDAIAKETLNMILVAEKSAAREGGLNAKQVGRLLKSRLREEYQNRGEDEFYRAIRYRVERLAPDKKVLDPDDTNWISRPDKMLSIRGSSSRPLFPRLNRSYQKAMI